MMANTEVNVEAEALWRYCTNVGLVSPWVGNVSPTDIEAAYCRAQWDDKYCLIDEPTDLIGLSGGVISEEGQLSPRGQLAASALDVWFHGSAHTTTLRGRQVDPLGVGVLYTVFPEFDQDREPHPRRVAPRRYLYDLVPYTPERAGVRSVDEVVKAITRLYQEPPKDRDGQPWYPTNPRLIVFEQGRHNWSTLIDRGVRRIDCLLPQQIEDLKLRSQGIGRIEGVLLAQEAGLIIAEGLTIFDDAIFKRWYEAGHQFTPNDKKTILQAARLMTEEFGKVSVRRALAIEGISGDPGQARGIIDKKSTDDQVLAAVTEIYMDAMRVASGDHGSNNGGLLERRLKHQNTKICFMFHRYVDPFEVQVENGELVWKPGQDLPVSLIIQPVEKDGGQWEIRVAWGNARSFGGQVRTYRINQLGRVELKPGQEGIDHPFHQEQMVCAVGNIEQAIGVPSALQGVLPRDDHEFGTLIARAVKMFHLATARGLKPTWNLELSLGLTPNGKETIFYVTQVTPKEINPGLLQAFEDTRLNWAIRTTKLEEIEALQQALEEHPKDKLFISIPYQLFPNRDWLESYLLPLLTENIDRIIVLVGANAAAGHFLDTLFANKISHFCIRDFPVELFHRQQIHFHKPEGFTFEIARVLEQGQVVLPLKDAWLWGIDECGAKGYYLSLLKHMGFATADGGLIPASATKAIVEQIDEGLRTTLGDFRNALKRAAQAFRNQPSANVVTFQQISAEASTLATRINTSLREIPAAIMLQIGSQLEVALGEKTSARIMGRSSVPNIEDVAGKPAAGLFESVGVNGELGMAECERAIINVYRSLFTPRVVEHIIRNFAFHPDIDRIIEHLGMAVIVPEYIETRRGIDLPFYLFSSQPGQSYVVLLSIADGVGADIAAGQGRSYNLAFDKTTGKIIDDSTVPPELRESARRLVQQIMDSQLIKTTEGLLGGRAVEIEGTAKNIISTELGATKLVLHQLRPFVC